jgi:predicted SprT family Zn-dependent metalloprotease
MICHGCSTAIHASEPTVSISTGTWQFGQKSQRFFHNPDQEVDVVIHYRCVFFYFDPSKDKEIYDHYYNKIVEQVRREEIDQLKEMAYDEVSSDVERLCPECRRTKEAESIDPDLPPEEYECPHCGESFVIESDEEA